MGYKVTILIREEAEKLETIGFEAETDYILSALFKVKRMIDESYSQIPKGIIEGIFIQKVN